MADSPKFRYRDYSSDLTGLNIRVPRTQVDELMECYDGKCSTPNQRLLEIFNEELDRVRSLKKSEQPAPSRKPSAHPSIQQEHSKMPAPQPALSPQPIPNSVPVPVMKREVFRISEARPLDRTIPVVRDASPSLQDEAAPLPKFQPQQEKQQPAPSPQPAYSPNPIIPDTPQAVKQPASGQPEADDVPEIFKEILSEVKQNDRKPATDEFAELFGN